MQVYHNGVKVRSRYGPNINSLLAGHTLGLVVTSDNCLHLFVNGVDQGVAATNIPDTVWVAVDLYGKCDEIAIVNNTGEEGRVSFVKETGDKVMLASHWSKQTTLLEYWPLIG